MFCRLCKHYFRTTSDQGFVSELFSKLVTPWARWKIPEPKVSIVNYRRLCQSQWSPAEYDMVLLGIILCQVDVNSISVKTALTCVTKNYPARAQRVISSKDVSSTEQPVALIEWVMLLKNCTRSKWIFGRLDGCRWSVCRRSDTVPAQAPCQTRILQLYQQFVWHDHDFSIF
jgi:hypothetical protein